jgi:hypothetical protein
MGQYRKNFMHNAVDGRLLLALDISTLKTELKIAPLGHRNMILEAIEQLRQSVPEGVERSLSPEARQGLLKGGGILDPTICRTRGSSPVFLPCNAMGSDAIRGLNHCCCAAVPLQKLPRPCSAPSPQPRPPTATGNLLPADNCLGPAAGKVTVYDNLKKLQYDLFRAEEKAKQVEAVKIDLQRKHRIYVDDVQRVKGVLRLDGAGFLIAHKIGTLP